MLTNHKKETTVKNATVITTKAEEAKAKIKKIKKWVIIAKERIRNQQLRVKICVNGTIIIFQVVNTPIDGSYTFYE